MEAFKQNELEKYDERLLRSMLVDNSQMLAAAIKTIKTLDVIAYEDLGTESIKRLEVEGFPAIVCCDMYGGDLLLAGKEEFRDQKALGAYQSVPPAEKAG